MGQLEKYGLYVLCLVIFLILGVTIWGTPASAVKKTENDNVAIRANALGIDPSTRTVTPVSTGGPNGDRVLTNAPGNAGLIQSWLKPGARPPRSGGNPTTGNTNTTGSTAGSSSGGRPSAGPQGSGPLGGTQPVTQPPVTTPVKTEPKPKPVAATRKYVVKRGDTLGEIAQKQLGSVRYIKRIQALNPGLKARSLRVGKSILLPTSVGGSKPVATGGASSYRTYTISSGDSFERIARIELGSAKRVKELIRLNSNIDPHRLIPGKKIKLPLK